MHGQFEDMKLNKAIFFVTQKVATSLVAKNRPGAIVNIGSMWAKQAIWDANGGVTAGHN